MSGREGPAHFCSGGYNVAWPLEVPGDASSLATPASVAAALDAEVTLQLALADRVAVVAVGPRGDAAAVGGEDAGQAPPPRASRLASRRTPAGSAAQACDRGKPPSNRRAPARAATSAAPEHHRFGQGRHAGRRPKQGPHVPGRAGQGQQDVNTCCQAAPVGPWNAVGRYGVRKAEPGKAGFSRRPLTAG